VEGFVELRFGPSGLMREERWGLRQEGWPQAWVMDSRTEAVEELLGATRSRRTGSRTGPVLRRDLQSTWPHALPRGWRRPAAAAPGWWGRLEHVVEGGGPSRLVGWVGLLRLPGHLDRWCEGPRFLPCSWRPSQRGGVSFFPPLGHYLRCTAIFGLPDLRG
jgi:hypothetical protein